MRVVLTNSKFRGVVPGSFMFRAFPKVSGYVDIAPWMAKGNNRIVLVQVDDKCSQSTLWYGSLRPCRAFPASTTIPTCLPAAAFLPQAC